MSHENLLIKTENEKFAMCIITDDHKTHLKSHIKHAYKLRIIRHIFDHLYLWYRAKKIGIPHISLEDVLSSMRGVKK